MGIGMARQIAAAALAGALTLACMPAARAAGEPAPAPATDPSCSVPQAELAAPEPLPNLAALIARREPLRILAIGASATGGSLKMPGEGRYQVQLVSLLQKALGGLKVEIINRGVSGEVAASAAERMKLIAAMERPNLVLWQVGTNDALARVPAEDFSRTLRDAVAWLREHQIDVVLVGLQYWRYFAKDPESRAIRDAVAQVAQEEHVLYIKRVNAMQFIAREQAKQAQPDSLTGEPDELRNRCMAEHIATALITNLFLRKPPPAPPK